MPAARHVRCRYASRAPRRLRRCHFTRRHAIAASQPRRQPLVVLPRPSFTYAFLPRPLPAAASLVLVIAAIYKAVVQLACCMLACWQLIRLRCRGSYHTDSRRAPQAAGRCHTYIAAKGASMPPVTGAMPSASLRRMKFSGFRFLLPLRFRAAVGYILRDAGAGRRADVAILPRQRYWPHIAKSVADVLSCAPLLHDITAGFRALLLLAFQLVVVTSAGYWHITIFAAICFSVAERRYYTLFDLRQPPPRCYGFITLMALPTLLHCCHYTPPLLRIHCHERHDSRQPFRFAVTLYAIVCMLLTTPLSPLSYGFRRILPLRIRQELRLIDCC